MTTIKLSKEVVGKLVALKTHPRDTYEDVIIRLIKEQETKTQG